MAQKLHARLGTMANRASSNLGAVIETGLNFPESVKLASYLLTTGKNPASQP